MRLPSSRRRSDSELPATMRPACRSKEPVMPLLDHFNPPLNRTHPWRSFHGAWAAAMARLLNQGVLPTGYYAVPLMDRNGPVEIDVVALPQRRVLSTWRRCGPDVDAAGARSRGRRRIAAGRCGRGPGVRRRRRPASYGRSRACQSPQQGPTAGASGVRRQVRRLSATGQRRRDRGHRYDAASRSECARSSPSLGRTRVP